MTDACKRCGHSPLDHRRAPNADPDGRDTLYPCAILNCSCPDAVWDSHTLWRIVVAPIDETDMIGILEFSSRLSHVWIEPAGGVVVETNPTGFGDFRDSRLIPWSRLLDFRKTGPTP